VCSHARWAPTRPGVGAGTLGAFRAALHACCTRRADALFELGDALLCAPSVPSLPHLSLEPVCRHGWGLVDAALARGRIDPERLRDLLTGSLPAADPPVFAVDVTTWPRCDAECQWICQLGFARDSWTAPLDARRLHPLDDTDHTAAAQVRALLTRLAPAGACCCWSSTPATTPPS
jgi:DDE superfamily endonuclease